MGKAKARGERNASGGQRIGKEDQFVLPSAKDVAHWHVGKGAGRGAIGKDGISFSSGMRGGWVIKGAADSDSDGDA